MTYATRAPDDAKTPVTEWDCHWASVPYESDRWASSDRGWLFGYTDETKTQYRCLGHYLDYSHCWDADVITKHGGAVYAVTTDPRGACHFATVEAAIAWIDKWATGQGGLFAQRGAS